MQLSTREGCSEPNDVDEKPLKLILYNSTRIYYVVSQKIFTKQAA